MSYLSFKNSGLYRLAANVIKKYQVIVLFIKPLYAAAQILFYTM